MRRCLRHSAYGCSLQLGEARVIVLRTRDTEALRAALDAGGGCGEAGLTGEAAACSVLAAMYGWRAGAVWFAGVSGWMGKGGGGVHVPWAHAVAVPPALCQNSPCSGARRLSERKIQVACYR